MAQEHLNALPLDHILHWYRLERVLGQGGFGITYLARDTNLDQRVAIKEYLPVDFAVRAPDHTVHPRSQNQSEGYAWGLERFIREAQTLAQFDHPNIVRVYSVFEQNNTAYMVMRYEQGENLQNLLDRGEHLDEGALLAIVLPILDGLERIHDAGFIHRDIKPDNIYIREDGSPVLLDFGSARRILGKTHTLTVLMSPGYAPFEQYHSTDEQGPWTDIYSLGATLYRAVTGGAPIDALARSKGVLGSTKDLLIPATKLGHGRYSQHFLEAIDHALAFSEKDRPQTIARWQAELLGKRVLATLGRRVRRALPPRAAVATAGLVLLVSLSVFIWQQIRPSPSPTSVSLEEPTAEVKRLTALEQELKILATQFEEQRRAEASLAKRQQAIREEQKRLEERRRTAEDTLSQEQQTEKQAEQEKLAALERELAEARRRLEENQQRLKAQRREANEERQRQVAAGVQREEKIAQLLAAAETDLTAERLSTPLGDNALEKFQQVLVLAPANEEAKNGISRIVDRYVVLAEEAIKQGQLKRTQGYLDKAAAIQPDAERVARVRARLVEEKSRSTKIAKVMPQRVTPEAKAYEVAIFPFGGDTRCHGWNRSPNAEVAASVRALVQQNGSLSLAYSHYDQFPKGPLLNSPESLWNQGERPNAQWAYSIGKERGLDVILTYWRSQSLFIYCSDNAPPYPVELYLFDVVQQRMYRKKGLEENLLAMTEQALSNFLRDRSDDIKAKTSLSSMTVAKAAPGIQQGTGSYKIGIFPGAGDFGFGRGAGTPWEEKYAAQIFANQVRVNASSLSLVYSYYDPGLNQPRIYDYTKVWGDTKPKLSAIYREADARNLDAVFLYRCTGISSLVGNLPAGPMPIELYLIDVKQKQTYAQKGDTDKLEKMVQGLISRFLQGQPR